MKTFFEGLYKFQEEQRGHATSVSFDLWFRFLISMVLRGCWEGSPIRFLHGIVTEVWKSSFLVEKGVSLHHSHDKLHRKHIAHGKSPCSNTPPALIHARVRISGFSHAFELVIVTKSVCCTSTMRTRDHAFDCNVKISVQTFQLAHSALTSTVGARHIQYVCGMMQCRMPSC